MYKNQNEKYFNYNKIFPDQESTHIQERWYTFETTLVPFIVVSNSV